ncbi:MAG: hypothetical protein Q7R81_07085 [Candidatus Peregrinibacteria bacterium]|nr:hypothetical protein [Candidatus Peregrinibacteria bacterium]
MDTTDAARRIEMTFLRKSGYLCGWAWKTIRWNCRGEPTGQITVKIATGSDGDNYYMELDYKTRSGDEEWRPMDYRVRLESTPCRYGGKRWWFRCPVVRCNRRNSILYQSGDYFVCRKCARLSYASQEYRSRRIGLLGRIMDAEKFEMTLKRWYYRGKPTRKHRKLLRMYGGKSPMEAVNAVAAALGMF